jgi:hypothetical protein
MAVLLIWEPSLVAAVGAGRQVSGARKESAQSRAARYETTRSRGIQAANL